MYREGSKRCACGLEGNPAPVKSRGWCATHLMRMRRTGKPGPPGLVAGSSPRAAQHDERSAIRLLELAPPKTSRGYFKPKRPGIVSLTWNDGTAVELAWTTLDAWRRRGWAFSGDPMPPDGRQELVLAPGIRATARAIIDRKTEWRRVRSLRASGSTEA